VYVPGVSADVFAFNVHVVLFLVPVPISVSVPAPPSNESFVLEPISTLLAEPPKISMKSRYFSQCVKVHRDAEKFESVSIVMSCWVPLTPLTASEVEIKPVPN